MTDHPPYLARCGSSHRAASAGLDLLRLNAHRDAHEKVKHTWVGCKVIAHAGCRCRMRTSNPHGSAERWRALRVVLTAAGAFALTACRARPTSEIASVAIDTPQSATERGRIDGFRAHRSRAPIFALATVAPAALVVANNERNPFAGPATGIAVALPFVAWTYRATRLPPPSAPDSIRENLGLSDPVLWRRYQLGFSGGAIAARQAADLKTRFMTASVSGIAVFVWAFARLRSGTPKVAARPAPQS